jgi:hypothetical protein
MAKSNRKDSSGKAKAKSTPKRSSGAIKSRPASKSSDKASRDRADWRDEAITRMRALILEADSEIVEERKWKKPSNPSGVPVFSQSGIVCTLEKYKNVVKLTFAKGASLPDPSRLFNSSLGGSLRRAIDIHEGEIIDARAFKSLVKAAVEKNTSSGKKGRKIKAQAPKLKRP